jgi:hypothetical protein
MSSNNNRDASGRLIVHTFPTAAEAKAELDAFNARFRAMVAHLNVTPLPAGERGMDD